MQLIRCTAKLLREAGLKPTESQHDDSLFSFLGQWHANLIYIDGRKSVLFKPAAEARVRFAHQTLYG